MFKQNILNVLVLNNVSRVNIVQHNNNDMYKKINVSISAIYKYYSVPSQ